MQQLTRDLTQELTQQKFAHAQASPAQPGLRQPRQRKFILHWFSSLAAGALCLLALSSASVMANLPEAQADAVTPVNINTASAEVLAERLVGIGLSRAQAIVAYRDANGNFQDAYELVAVRGVGEATVANNEAVIRLRD